jgi:hypothetical protein
VILDFSAGYLAHRALHLFPVPWRFHQVHHRMLGTVTASDRAKSVKYGLDEVDPARIGSFGGLLSLPFQRRVRPFLTEKSGSSHEYTDNMPA